MLEELGAHSASPHDAVDDPVFVLEVDETPLRKQITPVALFEKMLELEPLQHTLEKILACPLEISIQDTDEQD